MKMRLVALAATTRGIYKTDAGPGTLPKRFRLLEPVAAAAFRALEAVTGGLVYSDVMRSAEESLHAMQTKKGVAAPGYSGHNFGVSVDVAVEETLRLRKWQYGDLLAAMEAHGWHCHRRDGLAGYARSESWHFNHLGGDAARLLGLTKSGGGGGGGWGAAVEARILELHGAAFALDVAGVQAALKKLGMYAGDVDGATGPLTRAGLHAFQRAWMLPEGEADARTQRVLAFVAAEREVV